MKPGLHNIPEEDYHADKLADQPSLSASIVQILTEQSPLHAWFAHPRLNQAYKPDDDRKFDLGTVAHALLLEGLDKARCIEADDWRKKDTKAQAEAIREVGAVPLLRKDYESALGMVESARKVWSENEDLAGYALEDGLKEQTLLWQEPTGVWCRCKPDYLSKDRRLIVDAKFTKTSANPDRFPLQIGRMSYDSRAAFYVRGNRATGGPEDARYVYLPIEASAPYAGCFNGLDPAFMELGAQKVAQALQIWRACLISGKWPGYPTRICYASPKPWQLAEQEEREIENPFGTEYDPATLWEKP